MKGFGWRVGGEMSEKWHLIWPFFFILFLHSLGIFLFTIGFLLTRTELTTYSQCSDVNLSPCSSTTILSNTPNTPIESQSQSQQQGGNISSSSSSSHDHHHHRHHCWTKPAVDRLIIIVLDALRFDFVAPSAFFDEVKPWMDKLQVLQRLASDKTSSARIFKAIADPPTTSLQRLKGLTTGGLPTFIDVGNSFGAPAIVEDNFIYQLARNGKSVLMMGDDTWMQLFPDHFQKSYPFPSFNVKDLDTVDNGCIDHLFPSLYQDDWDVLIAHFLGVDHAGHIFGVESTSMIEKLEQYNDILEKVIEILKNESAPGGLHENTFLVVMGDHGQTVNGDHGGGTAEEVETSLFAMSLKKPPASIPSKFDTSSCKLDMDGKETCAGALQQLDFSVTMASLLGLPFPFGSIGRVNPELYALSGGTWSGQCTNSPNCKYCSKSEMWMLNYANVLCINCWQVKRYIDLYSASSVIGFSKEDLLHISEAYAQAQAIWTTNLNSTFINGSEVLSKSCVNSSSVLLKQIDAYSDFLATVATLARSKWTEFDLRLMGVGICILLISLLFQLFAVRRAHRLCQTSYPSVNNTSMSVRSMSALGVVAIRACSLLSNSYILAEGKVANFLLATTGIFNLRNSSTEEKLAIEAVAFLLLNFIFGFSTELGLSKQAADSVSSEIAPVLGLMLLAFLLYWSSAGNSCWIFLRHFFVMGTIVCYILMAVHWSLESNTPAIPMFLKTIGKNTIPQIIYGISFGLLALLACAQMFEDKQMIPDYIGRSVIATMAILSAWSSIVLILLGRQGPFVVLLSIVGGWCIIRLQKLRQDSTYSPSEVLATDPISVMQWSLLAVCLFFYTGHWCTFDGLRYGAAFSGFDDFDLIRQGFLLAIDTFGISHILPILGLPLLAPRQFLFSTQSQGRSAFFATLTQVFLIYGLITSVTATFTVICVTIQRRHLMVWGLFAPKYVFDVLGLIATDVLICFASLYYF